MKREKEKAVNNEIDNESIELNIEELTEVAGGIDDDEKDVPIGSCGLGCYLGSGTEEPTGKEQ